jgi:ketosteroid isomerase-like protein
MKMRARRTVMTALAALFLSGAPCAFAPCAFAQGVAADAKAGVKTFNAAMIKATRTMDNAALLALWEEDGTALLPNTPPIVGKAALTKFYTDVMAGLGDATMKSFEMQCLGLEISGDLATEYCTEHQVVDLGPGKPPFDGKGTMLFVLHRGRDGAWRLTREMWNAA